MKPLRIMIDARHMYGPKRGIGYYMEQLMHGLAKIDSFNQYTLFYVSGRADPTQILRLPYPNFRTRVLRVPNGWFVRTFTDGKPYQMLRRLPWGCDIVHEPAFEPLPLAPRLVLTLHDTIFFRLPDHFAPEVTAHHQRRLRESVKQAAQIMADSEWTRRDAIELLGVEPERIHTVHLGVSPEAFEAGVSDEEAARKLKELGVDGPYFVSIGDVIRRKNLITTVRAFARLPAEIRQNTRYVIAGAQGADVAGELRAEIEMLGLTERVLMPGYISHAARRALLTRASALLYPTISEGFGLPPLEAMACGVPSVSSDNTSVPEVVGDAGILIQDYLNPDAWADAMARILTDETLRTDLIARGHARAATFTWERTARETLKVYELAART